MLYSAHPCMQFFKSFVSLVFQTTTTESTRAASTLKFVLQAVRKVVTTKTVTYTSKQEQVGRKARDGFLITVSKEVKAKAIVEYDEPELEELLPINLAEDLDLQDLPLVDGEEEGAEGLQTSRATDTTPSLGGMSSVFPGTYQPPAASSAFGSLPAGPTSPTKPSRKKRKAEASPEQSPDR